MDITLCFHKMQEYFWLAGEPLASQEGLWFMELVSYFVNYHLKHIAVPANWNSNPLNAELNPICHFLILLGDLTFMGPCIVNIFQYTCIDTTLHNLFISGNCSTYFGWKYHPKYVEQFPYINKLCNFASCCIYMLEFY